MAPLAAMEHLARTQIIRPAVLIAKVSRRSLSVIRRSCRPRKLFRVRITTRRITRYQPQQWAFLTSTPILETISISLCILVSSTSVAVQAEAPASRISKTLSPAIESGIAVAEDLISLETGVLLYRIGRWQDKRLTEAEQKAALQAVVNKAPKMMGDDFHTEVDATAGSE